MDWAAAAAAAAAAGARDLTKRCRLLRSGSPLRVCASAAAIRSRAPCPPHPDPHSRPSRLSSLRRRRKLKPGRHRRRTSGAGLSLPPCLP